MMQGLKYNSHLAMAICTFLAVVANAQTAEPISCEGQMVKVKGKSLYHGIVEFEAEKVATGYRLRDCKRGIVTLDLQQETILSTAVDVVSENDFFDAENAKAAVSTFWAAQKLYDYYLTTFNWHGYDNKGTPLYQYVHYGKNYFNAQFDNGVAIYGDGGKYNSTAIVSVDYVGHEVSHGLSANTAGLIYQGESGALNESFSDILGKSFEISITSVQRASWDMFPDIYKDDIMSTRSMQYPNAIPVDRDNSLPFLAQKALSNIQTVLKQQPKYYRSELWYFGSKDSGGVHTNSGVQNYWYYLLVNGGKGKNNLGFSYDIKGIGLDKAIQIVWRNLSVYLRKNAQYMDARYGSEQAAIDLFGQHSFEHITVQKSWDAVAVVDNNLDKSPQVDKNFTEISLFDRSEQNPVIYDAALATFVNQKNKLTSQDTNGELQGNSPNKPQAWFIHSSSNVANYQEFSAYQNWQFIADKNYQIRFTERGGQAMFSDATGITQMKPVPFEVWLIANDSTPNHDVRMIPIVFDIDNDGKFGLFRQDKSPYGYSLDHPAFAGENDPWTDMIHIAEPRNKSAGDLGYQTFVQSNIDKVNKTEIGETHLQWLSFVSENRGLLDESVKISIYPKLGTIFTVKTSSKKIEPKLYIRPEAIGLMQ